MTPRWDRIMLAYRTCRSRTARRLSDAEFRCFIAALCLAGQSPVRGYLLIAEGEPVSAADLADEAGGGVDEATAESALDKLTALGALAADRQRGCLHFPNWHEFNPSPKPSDSREAWAERKRRQRQREREAKQRERDAREPQLGRKGTALRGVEAPSDDLTGGELALPIPPSGRRKRDQDAYTASLAAFCAAHFPDVNQGYVVHEASRLRRQGVEPTVVALREALRKYERRAS